MRIHIRRHMIHLGTAILMSVVHGKRMEGFGGDPASLKGEVPKKECRHGLLKKKPIIRLYTGRQ